MNSSSSEEPIGNIDTQAISESTHAYNDVEVTSFSSNIDNDGEINETSLLIPDEERGELVATSAAEDTADGTVTGTPKPARIVAYDLLRGLIVILMSIDHARMFLSGVDFGGMEFWNNKPHYHQNVWYFLTRFITEVSAPGFFLLMGIGAAFLHNARKRLWGPSKILRYFFIRGAILIVLSLTLFNYFFLNPQDGMRVGLGVLFPLGMDLILCGCLIVVYEKFCTTRFRRIVGNISILLIAFIIYCITEFVVHWARKFPDSTEFHPLIRLTILTGRTGILFAHYTFLPWLVPCLWGVFFGLTCKSFRGRKAAVVNLFISFALFCIYLLIHHFRSYGTLYPASVEIPLFDNPVMDFLYNTKYPPSLAFLTLMLGINHLLLSIAFIFPISTNRQNAPEDITSNLNGSRDLTVLKYCKLSLLLLYRIVFNMLLAFGKSALFFYVLHFFGYMVISAIVHAIPRYKDGTGIGGFWPWWFLGVLCYWPVCSKFERFKHSKPVDSVWRFF